MVLGIALKPWGNKLLAGSGRIRNQGVAGRFRYRLSCNSGKALMLAPVGREMDVDWKERCDVHTGRCVEEGLCVGNCLSPDLIGSTALPKHSCSIFQVLPQGNSYLQLKMHLRA